MGTARPFRFSVNIFGVENRRDFVATCRRAERSGYDLVMAPDHLGAAAPFPLLVAAAEATERLRVGTLVLNSGFWNPALLAREIATTDILTDGRLEVGLGAGHMKWEFDEAGIPWTPFAARARRLADTIEQLRHYLTTDLTPLPAGRAPRPVQRHGFGGSGPPLLVGGTGDRILRIAARYADTVGVAGVYQIPGKPPGTFRLGTADEAQERVRFARAAAGARADEIEWHLLVQAVVETEDRHQAAAELLERFPAPMSVEQVLQTPYLLIGTTAEMAEQLRRSRERYGFTHVSVHEPYLDAFAPVIEQLSG